MKNEFELSNEFEVLSDGSFQFKRKVSFIQFIGGFIFVGIPIVALLIMHKETFKDLLFAEITSFEWQFNWAKLRLSYQFENHNISTEINLITVFILIYISAALFYRNILFIITKNHKITIDKPNKIVQFEFYKKSFAVPFAELSHFKIKIDTEMSNIKGRGIIKVYVVCLAKKDGEEYELMRYKKNKEKAEKFLEYIQSEFTFEGHSTGTAQNAPFKTALNSSNNGLVWSRKIRWYFYTNCLVYSLLATQLFIFSFNNISEARDVSLIFFLIVLLGFLTFGLYLVIILLVRAIKHQLNYNELIIDKEGVALYRNSKLNDAKKLINKIPFDEILTIRQMPINNSNYIGNIGIAIISKKDEDVLKKEQDTFTKKFTNSIGFQLAEDDYTESVLVENFIESKLPK